MSACRAILVSLLFALLMATTPAPAQSEVRLQQASAYARTGTTLLHRESHWRYRLDGLAHHLVLYQCRDGRAFARKLLIERASAQAPDFDFEDARDGYREGVRSGPGGRVVYLRQSADARLDERALRVPDGAVVDAGFDAGVRLHWDTLRAGGEVSLPFLLPSRFAFMPVRLVPGPALRWSGIPARRLSMKLDRWYAFVAPTMQLTYAVADRRLLEFAGVATIRDGKGRHQDVRIVFPDPEAPADLRSLRTALDTPLVRRCAD